MSTRITPNHREIIAAQSSITGQEEYLTSTNGALNINGSFSVTGGATSANQINGQQLVQIVDAGGEAVTVTGGKLDVNATASLAGTALPIAGATTAVGVAIVDSSGNQISSFGGGTQYADGAARGTATGTLMMVDDGTNIQSAAGNSSGELIVQAKQNGTWNINNISGTISLPTGASTAAKQPALGTAGSASADVITIQGIASMTKLLVTPDSVALPANQSVNVSQINGVTPLMGNGVTGTGSQRVTIASDNTPFSVNATLAAETTKVIGTVNQGTSPWVTSNAVTSIVGNGAAAPAQRVTLANDSTGVIATVGAVTAITNALPAGTNAIGKLAANSGVIIGDVNVVSNIPGTGATNLGKAEDAGHSSGDTGVMSLAVRNDNGGTLAGTDLDYIPLTTNSRGDLWVAPESVVSTANSSTATLIANAVFTGTSEEVKDFATIVVSVISNVASATDGLSIQQSSDATNWDITDTYTIAAATGKTFSFNPAARYFRIVYTNGGTGQASFRLQTIFHRVSTKASSQRSSDAYSNENDLEEVWAFNSIYNGTTWDRTREAVNALNSTGTGIPTAQIIGQFDDVAPTAITENQFGNIRMSANRNLYGTIRDAAGNERGVNVTAGNALQSDNTSIAGTATAVNNGTASAGTQRVTLASDSTGNIATIGTSVVPGTSATHLGKAEDAAHTTGDTGVFALAVRNDGAATSFSGTNGDYTPIGVDAAGTVSVVQKAGTATLTNVASSATNVTLLAANTARKAATIFNDSTQILYVKFGATASSSSYTVQLATNTYYEVPGGYTGIIDGIWASANGNARVTEIS